MTARTVPCIGCGRHVQIIQGPPRRIRVHGRRIPGDRAHSARCVWSGAIWTRFAAEYHRLGGDRRWNAAAAEARRIILERHEREVQELTADLFRLVAQ